MSRRPICGTAGRDATGSQPGRLRFRGLRRHSCQLVRGRHWGPECGMALIAVLLVMVFVGVLAGGLVLLASGEVLVAGNHRDTIGAQAAAAAALEVGGAELRRLADWNLALGGTVRSGFVDTTTSPTIGGRRVDLALETAALQAGSGGATWGPDAPVWVLYAYGPASALGAGAPSDSGLYLLVWVADDGGDGDANPRTDANAIVQVWAEARGSSGLRRRVRGVFERTEPAPAALRRLAWRYGS
jgi:hypothetical protein